MCDGDTLGRCPDGVKSYSNNPPVEVCCCPQWKLDACSILNLPNTTTINVNSTRDIALC